MPGLETITLPFTLTSLPLAMVYFRSLAVSSITLAYRMLLPNMSSPHLNPSLWR